MEIEKMDIKEIATDVAALAVIGVVAYQSITMVQVSDEMKTILGAAVAYLFIKHSPNSV